jgi:hypothetical protein
MRPSDQLASMTDRSDTAEPGQDLILGTVEHYDFHVLSPFLITLQQTDFEGHVCLFAGPGISRSTIRKIRSHGVEVIRYGARFPFVQDPHPESPKVLPEPIYVFNYRHFLYLDYLLRHRGKFRKVLLTDVRDVVFQANPLAIELGNRLHVAMESTRIPIGQCAYTSQWILAGYGQDVLLRLKDAELSCAGTTMGSEPVIRAYLRSMLDQINRMADAYECADQAAHNLLLHDGLLDPVTRHYNFRGFVLTVGTEDGVRFDGRHELINEDGSLVAIVHQYDRHPALARLFEMKAYPSWWRRSAAKAARLRARALRKAMRVFRRPAGIALRKLGLLSRGTGRAEAG